MPSRWTTPGRMLFASGQLGVSPDDQIPEDAEAQAVLCFESIKAILAEAGMTLADVVRFTAYVTDRACFPVCGAVRQPLRFRQRLRLHPGDRLGLRPARAQGRGGGDGGAGGLIPPSCPRRRASSKHRPWWLRRGLPHPVVFTGSSAFADDDDLA